MTQVVRTPTAADFLASVPALAGYTARNSVMCVAFSGKRTCGAFRFDLPVRRRTADYRRLASVIISTLSRMPTADGLAIVIYTDETFEAAHGIPLLELGREVTDRVLAQGFGMNDAFCVSPDGWASYFDRDYPREGRPLADIEQSAIGVAVRAGHGSELRDIREEATLSTPGPLTTSAVRYALEDPLSLLEAVESEGSPEVVDWVEHCLEQESWSITQLAWLLELAQSPSDRDVMLLQIAFGREVGEREHAKNEYYLEVQRETGQTMDDLMREEMESGRISPDDELLLGRGSKRPKADRVKTGIAMMRAVTAAAPEVLRPAPLCILAWLSWSLGHGSAAGAFVDMALAIDPSYSMAQLMFTLFGSGMIADWAFAETEPG